MKISVRASLAATLIVGLCVPSASEAADATSSISDPSVEQMLVRGVKTEFVIDAASLRVDTKQYARSLQRGVSAALERESGETRVAVAEGRTIG